MLDLSKTLDVFKSEPIGEFFEIFSPPQPPTAHRLWPPGQLLEIADNARVSPNGPWIAGGCFTRLYGREMLNENHGDVDVFARDNKQVNVANAGLSGNSWRLEYESHRSTIWSKFGYPNVNVVHEWMKPTLGDVLGSFDFKACAIGTDGEVVKYHESALKDINNRELHLISISHPTRTIMRLSKYALRGYRFDPELVRDILRYAVHNPESIELASSSGGGPIIPCGA